MKKILILGGFDPSGGAGLAADLRAAKAVGVTAFPIATCLAMQTHEKFIALKPIPAAEICAQIENFSHHPIDAIKIGALGHLSAWPERFVLLKRFACPIVLDPVLQTTSGGWLCDPAGPEALPFLFSNIFPQVDLITPNYPEAKFLLQESDCQSKPPLVLAKEIFEKTGKNILLKGGHYESQDRVTDYFVWRNGLEEISLKRVDGKTMRGTGCFLATAIAGFLAQARSPNQACREAVDLLLSHRAIN